MILDLTVQVALLLRPLTFHVRSPFEQRHAQSR
jgi:hypothetical protein